ncbi:hypothetical protein DGWBC_0711 [Dehalogenimonas sp. WBC-2]|nr:hypothetical protein DGWBC_0711 [Dehalogenimonas sp. WBC-2]
MNILFIVNEYIQNTESLKSITVRIPWFGRMVERGCLAFPLLFLAGTAIVEARLPEYNRISQTISQLALGSWGWIENVLFVLFGLLLLGISLRLKEACIPLTVAGIAFFVIALCPTQSIGDPRTFTNAIHEFAAMTTAAMLPVTCFKMTNSGGNSLNFDLIRTVCVTVGVCGLVLNLLGFVMFFGDRSLMGIVERLIMLNGLVWLQVVGIYFMQLSGGTQRQNFYKSWLNIFNRRRPIVVEVDHRHSNH